MRFVLPTFPCYYLAGMWALQALAADGPGPFDGPQPGAGGPLGGGFGPPGGQGRFPRAPGMAGGLQGLSPDIREAIIAGWTWQPTGPR